MTPQEYLKSLDSDKRHGKFMALGKMFLHERATPDFQGVVLKVMEMTMLPPVMMRPEHAEEMTRGPIRPGSIFLKKE